MQEIQRLQQLLLNDEDGQLSAIRSRLVRLARARGVAPEAIDDVVQETFLEAWKHMDRLYAPSGFEAWLDEICRNICRRYAQRRALDLQRSTPLFPYDLNVTDREIEPATESDAVDLADPLEALCRQDMQLLLDRALSVLPQATRQLLEQCYLLELPHTEVAARLDITVGTLDTRLHRARRQLRHILSGPLRAEAEAFDLRLDQDIATGWHETRLWCPLCAQHRLQGCFIEHTVASGPNLHLRCPACSQRYGQDTIHSMGLVSLAGLRSFKPAWKRAMQGLTDRVLQALPQGQHPCLMCGKPATLQVVGRDTDPGISPGPYPFWLHWRCAHCGETIDSSGDVPSVDQLVYWSHPLTRQFMQQHQRWRSQPGTPLEYEGQQAICFQISDLESSDTLSVLAQRQTLHVLKLF